MSEGAKRHRGHGEEQGSQRALGGQGSVTKEPWEGLSHKGTREHTRLSQVPITRAEHPSRGNSWGKGDESGTSVVCP